MQANKNIPSKECIYQAEPFGINIHDSIENVDGSVNIHPRIFQSNGSECNHIFSQKVELITNSFSCSIRLHRRIIENEIDYKITTFMLIFLC